MKDVSQIQSEADPPRVEFLKAKTKIRVGSWNMRTLYQTGKHQQVLRGIENHMELLCLQHAGYIRVREPCQLDIPFFILPKKITSTEMDLP